MPRFHLTPQDQQIQRLGTLNQIGSQADAADSRDMSSMMDMFAKMYGLQQEQATAPAKLAALQSETEKNKAMAGAEEQMGRYHGAMADSIPSRSELNTAKAQDEESKAFMKLYPGGIESIKDPYSAEQFFHEGSPTRTALHAAGDRMYLQHHDPLWALVQQGQATPEMQASPYLNEGEKWVAAHAAGGAPKDELPGLGAALHRIPEHFQNADDAMTTAGTNFWGGLFGYKPSDEAAARQKDWANAQVRRWPWEPAVPPPQPLTK